MRFNFISFIGNNFIKDTNIELCQKANILLSKLREKIILIIFAFFFYQLSAIWLKYMQWKIKVYFLFLFQMAYIVVFVFFCFCINLANINDILESFSSLNLNKA